MTQMNTSRRSAAATRRRVTSCIALLLGVAPLLAAPGAGWASESRDVASQHPAKDVETARGELHLLMFESDSCHWCRQWHREIGPAYPNTAEGQSAPLVRRDIYAPMPEDVALSRRPRFTPTFVLVQNGVEVGRIEGYPGEDFFWPMLAEMIERAKTPASGG